MACSGHGDVPKARIEQIGMNAGISVDEHPFRGEALRTVASDGVAMIEMAVFGGVELNQFVVVESSADASIRRDGFDNSKIAVGDAERPPRCGKLDAVSDGKLMGYLPIDADSGKAARIVSGKCAGLHFDGEEIR